MKKLFLLVLLVNTSFAQNPTLRIIIKGFESNKGKLFLEVLDNNKKSIKQLAEVVRNQQVAIELKELSAGKYSVRVFHDENNNSKLDTGMFGIPKEPWGMSNNVKAVLGPPKFEESIFELKGNKEISIDLH